MKKMLYFVNSNTDGVRVLVCPAIFGTLDRLCDRCLNLQAGVMPIYWLMFANVFAYGRCYWHAFCGRYYCHCDVFFGRYYCHILLADVIAMICILLSLQQMLLPLWLLLLPLLGMMYHSIADVMAIFRVI